MSWASQPRSIPDLRDLVAYGSGCTCECLCGVPRLKDSCRGNRPKDGAEREGETSQYIVLRIKNRNRLEAKSKLPPERVNPLNGLSPILHILESVFHRELSFREFFAQVCGMGE